MPIKIQNDLPVKEILENENLFVVDENRATHQDIRPLQLCILNLMPKKEETELQLLRMLSNTPLQIDITFMRMSSHRSLNTPVSHLLKFYYTFEELKEQRFDGLIITGAPVEKIDYEDVDYWPCSPGARPMYSAPSTSAGAPRPRCITITGSRRGCCPRSCSASIPTR